MDIHPWTKYEIARARHEERPARAMAAIRAREIRSDKASEVGRTMRTSSWLARLRRRDITAQPESAGPVSAR